jgi:hypothetical protein
MGLARKYQICVSETPYCHIISRCVRRAFLCGEDASTGFSYEHRRAENCSCVFCINYIHVAQMDCSAHAISG